MEEFETIDDVPTDKEFLQAIRESKASSFVSEFARISDDELPEGVSRNSVKRELQKYCYWEDEISAEALNKNYYMGGGFFTAIWNGNLDEALMRADSNNQKILDSLGYNERLRA